MKVYDSGMPDETYWNTLFDVQTILTWLNPTSGIAPIAEIGCGYGTFTVPIAGSVAGMIHAFDIDPGMIQDARNKVRSAGLQNVAFYQRDVIEIGTGLPDESIRTVLLFNILHSAYNRLLLKESARVLQRSGSVYILHWRNDIITPRGPSLESRPDLNSIVEQIGGLDLVFGANTRIFEPYHWGMELTKGGTNASRDNA
jgi:ubiquinone/menaquinone biosynthesis C-methylase UbiE